MKIVAIIVTIVCCGLMFYVKREWKAAMLVMGIMTLTLVEIPRIPMNHANYLLPLSFLASEWEALLRHFKRLRDMPYIWIPLLIVSISILLAVLTTHYVKPFTILQEELFFKYFALAYAFWAIKDEKSLKPVLQVSLCCLIALTFFGVLNYIEKNAMFVNALTEGNTSLSQEGVTLGDVYTKSTRFRVQSMFKSAFDYGYICAAMLILHLHGWHRKLESNKVFIIAIACCSFGILTCGCRIVWVCAIFSLICYSMWVFKLNRNVMYGMIAMILMILSYLTIPAVEEKVNKVTDVFVEESNTGGSSIQLRMTQFASVLIQVEGHEWVGLGKGYWFYNLKDDPQSIRDLFGIESVILQYLLEQGIIGLVLWVSFYTIIFLYFWRNRKKRKALSGLGGSILALYLVFSIGTGELGSVYPTMLLLGMAMKMIESKKRRRMLYAILLRIMKRKHLTRKQQLVMFLKAISK